MTSTSLPSTLTFHQSLNLIYPPWRASTLSLLSGRSSRCAPSRPANHIAFSLAQQPQCSLQLERYKETAAVLTESQDIGSPPSTRNLSPSRLSATRSSSTTCNSLASTPSSSSSSPSAYSSMLRQLTTALPFVRIQATSWLAEHAVSI